MTTRLIVERHNKVQDASADRVAARWNADVLMETMHSENISDAMVQLSSGDAWHVEVTEDDKLDV